MRQCANDIIFLIGLLHLSFCYVEYCEKSVFYLHNEAANESGSHRCSNSCDCDGLRTCSSWSWCQGNSRQKSIKYYYNEALSNSECDPISPIKHYYCNSMRVCSSEGKCIDP